MKQNSVKIAVTGGIGSGKSTLINYLRQKNLPVHSCDEVYSRLIKTQKLKDELKKHFGPNIFDGEGELDRAALSATVFSNPEKLKILNQVTHNAIFKKMFSEAEGESGVQFFEVPLLFEGGHQNLFDGVIVILRDSEERIKSVSKRDGVCRFEVEKRIKSQYNYENQSFAKYYVTHNNGDLSQFYVNIDNILLKIANDFKL